MMKVTKTDLDGKHPEEITAMVYVMAEGHDRLEMPSKGYFSVLAEGYREFGFDDRYLRFALLEAIDEQEKREAMEGTTYDFS